MDTLWENKITDTNIVVECVKDLFQKLWELLPMCSLVSVFLLSPVFVQNSCVLPVLVTLLIYNKKQTTPPSSPLPSPHSGTSSITHMHIILVGLSRGLSVCAVVTTLRANHMMSKRRASNLIKKEIKVDVCYFQLRHSTAICQSQRCDCFGPTVIRCLSKY